MNNVSNSYLNLGQIRYMAIGQVLFGRPGSVRRPFAFLIVSCVTATMVAPAFMTISNIQAVLISSSFLVVAAVGEAFVIMLGSIDLGVESVLAAGGMMLAWLTVFHAVPSLAAIPLTLLAGGIVGAAVGLLVTYGRVPSIVATLGTYWGIRGVALLFNNGKYISPYSVNPPKPFGFSWISGDIGGIPVMILIAAGVVTIAQAIVSFTPVGSWVKTVGSNENAARSVGLSTTAIKVAVFTTSGVLASLAGIMVTAWQHSIYPLTAEGASLTIIAGVILGGIPLTGGRGTIVGAALGVIIIGIIHAVIVLVGLPARYQYIFVACVLILAGLQARSSRSGITK